MDTIVVGRASDSPYIEMVWTGRTGSNYAPVCPADPRWNLLMIKYEGRIKVTVEGPLTRATPKTHPEGMEWLVIKFKLGAFIPNFPVDNLRDGDLLLPSAAGQSFWLNGSAWQLPDYDNAETFVEWLVHEDILVHDPVVQSVLQEHPQDISLRTIRRRFLRSTGLTHKAIQQIERAQEAVTQLENGMPILDVVYGLGYADQAHMTRSLKHFIGQTPAKIARVAMEN